MHNKGRNGGAIYSQNSEINFQGNTMFLENEGEYGGALCLYENVSVIVGRFEVAEVSFVRNHAHKSGGAIYARSSKIVISIGQKLSFVENEGYDGGAMTLSDGSTIHLEALSEANSSITFVRNHAYHCGEPAAEISYCFCEIFSTDIMPDFVLSYYMINYIKTAIDIQFYNNTAGVAGTAIYGGWIDLCYFRINDHVIFNYDYEYGISQASIFDSLFHFHQSTQQLSVIASNPTRVCVCTNMSIPDCNITNYSITAYPGETLKISAVAVGQRFGTVPSTVHSNFVSRDNGRLPSLQNTQ